MHYTVDYSPMDNDLIAKHNKAIEDIKEFLGEERFTRITVALKNEYRTEQPTLEQFRMLASFAGVQGYPATAWYNHIWPL